MTENINDYLDLYGIDILQALNWNLSEMKAAYGTKPVERWAERHHIIVKEEA